MILPPRPGQILVFSCGHLAASSGMYSVIRQCAAVTTHLSAINVPPHPPWKKTSKNYPHLIFPPFPTRFPEVFGRQQSMATPQPENWKVELNRKEMIWRKTYSGFLTSYNFSRFLNTTFATCCYCWFSEGEFPCVARNSYWCSWTLGIPFDFKFDFKFWFVVKGNQYQEIKR